MTLKPAGNVQRAAGIPPHIHMHEDLVKVNTKLNAVSEDMSGLLNEVQEAVKMAMDEQGAKCGQLTVLCVMEIIMEKISGARNSLQTAMADAVKGELQCVIDLANLTNLAN